VISWTRLTRSSGDALAAWPLLISSGIVKAPYCRLFITRGADRRKAFRATLIVLKNRVLQADHTIALAAPTPRDLELDNLSPGWGPTSRMTDREMGAQGR